MEEDRVIEAPEKFLKRYVEDLVGECVPLFFPPKNHTEDVG